MDTKELLVTEQSLFTTESLEQQTKNLKLTAHIVCAFFSVCVSVSSNVAIPKNCCIGQLSIIFPTYRARHIWCSKALVEVSLVEQGCKPCSAWCVIALSVVCCVLHIC